MEKKTTKRRVIAITVLASLLVALLAFNVTYAYFTDKVSGSAQITFGKISLTATTAISAATANNVFPGSSFKLNGVITVGESSQGANDGSTGPLWVYFGVSGVEMKIGETTIAENVQNPNYRDGTSGGHRYTAEDISSMTTAVQTSIINGLATAINQGQVANPASNENSNAWAVDTSTATGATPTLTGMTTTAVPTTTPDFNFANAGELLISGNSFGNLFQGVTISFTIVIKAIQASNVTKAQAKSAFQNNTAGAFESGKDLIV